MVGKQDYPKKFSKGKKTHPLTFRGIYPKAVEKWELWNVQRIHGMGLYTQNGGKVETVAIPPEKWGYWLNY